MTAAEAGMPDLGEPDGGPNPSIDARPEDTGAEDTGAEDTGAEDTGAPDSGDTGPVDGGGMDTGPEDTGTGPDPCFEALGVNCTDFSEAYLKASNTGASDNFGQSVAVSGDGNTVAVGAPFEASAATGVGGNQFDNSAREAGAVYVFTRGAAGTWSQQAYLKASNTGPGDGFGWALAMSSDGDTLAVGALFEASASTNQADNSAFRSGAVYVFTRSGSTWSQPAYLKASNIGRNDKFGQDLAMSGNGEVVAVGAPGEDSAATGVGGDETSNALRDSGAVYVFGYDGAAWTQRAYLKASNTGPGDELGAAASLALSRDGRTLAVGAFFEDSGATGVGGTETDDSVGDSGAVYVFTEAFGGWSQQAYLKASNTGEGDWFGFSTALSANGDILVVGAPSEDSAATGVGGNQLDDSAGAAGAVYVFTRSGAAWSQTAYIKASNTDSNDRFGDAVALDDSGAGLAVGAVEDSSATGVNGNQGDNSARNAGAVYLFTRSGSTWTQQAYVKASNTESFDAFGVAGKALAVSGAGDRLVMGASGEDSAATGVNGNEADNSLSFSGAVYIRKVKGP